MINGFLALSAGGALALLILRYRRFGSQQRHQIRWPFYGIAVAVAWGLLIGAGTVEVQRNYIAGKILRGDAPASPAWRNPLT